MQDADEFERAVESYRQGHAAEAEALCRTILARTPTHPRALFLIGTIRYSAGDAASGIEFLERAIAAQANYVEAEFTLGGMLAAAGKLDAAADHFRRAAALRPAHPDPLIRLGSVLLELGELSDAEATFRRALTLRPEDAIAAADLATVMLRQGNPDEAVKYGRRAVALAPDAAATHLRLGLALKARHGADAAHHPSDRQDAEKAFRNALRIQPAEPTAIVALVEMLRGQNRLLEAAEICEQAIAPAPGCFEALAALSGILVTMGEVGRGVSLAQDARRLRPDDPKAHRELILYLELAEGIDAAQVLDEAREWQARFAAPLSRNAAPHVNVRTSDRVLRVGYLGGGLLRRTPLTNVMLPIIENHDRQNVEVFCYSDLTPAHEDIFSEKFRALTTWRRTGELDDAALADLIRQDRIDILVDCPQFFPGSRMLALARRPAPVQIAFPLNATVGGGAVDYVIADDYIVPPETEKFFAESVLRIPIAHSYRAFEEAPLPTQRPPSLSSSHVTFGSFNWLSKISPGTITAWARVLDRVPHSKLVIKCSALHEPKLARQFLDRFAASTIDPRRIEIRPWTATFHEHMSLFNEIDIVLDTFPYNGVTTTCDALWMGVPVVTLVGQKVLGRYGLALLRSVDFEDGIAWTIDEYVAAAHKLAADPARLAALRPVLSSRFQRSPICTGDSVTRSVEEAYRKAWSRWCTRQR
jgi:predicted O-linked N-acetylglucosamine transferase (SPINDLY family)